jgi:hypothetical protein
LQGGAAKFAVCFGGPAVDSHRRPVHITLVAISDLASLVDPLFFEPPRKAAFASLSGVRRSGRPVFFTKILFVSLYYHAASISAVCRVLVVNSRFNLLVKCVVSGLGRVTPRPSLRLCHLFNVVYFFFFLNGLRLVYGLSLKCGETTQYRRIRS